MSSHRLLIPAMLATALVGLGCSGLMGDGAGPPNDKPDAPEKRADLKVGTSGIKRGGGRTEKVPTGSTVDRRRKKDEYVVKLAPGVKGLKFKDGKPVTGNGKVDGAFGQLALASSQQVHDHSSKIERAAEVLGLGRTIHIRTSKPMDEVIARLEALPEVEWVEPVTEVTHEGKGGGGRAGAAGAGAPNDPYFSHQWHMQALNVTEAWGVTQGEGVVVAVIDTGVSVNEDGFHKLLPGWDFVENDSDPRDMNGHGTHVAGTIGQASNNGIGVAGVAPKVSILPVRVLDANGSGSNTWVAAGIVWAVDNGANVINLSLGSPANSEAVADACAYAYENGVTVIAATGNDGFTDFIGYPAALPTTIAVGAVDEGKQVSFYSNQGQQIDLVAPGGDTTADRNADGLQDGVVQETIMNGQWGYYFLQGTSMATPHVAGVAALVYANGVRDPDAIRQILTSTASDLGNKGWDTTYGAGLVNPVAALGAKAPRDTGGDKLAILRSRVKKTSDNRAVIGWLTNTPAMTYVKGSNGFERMEKELTKVHQITVQGKPGQTVKFTFGSQLQGGDGRVKDEIEVTF